jgi:integrase
MVRKRSAANGEGTIGQRKKGRHKGKYEAALTIGRKPDGKLDRVHQLFERRTDADAWLQEQKRKRDAGQLVKGKITVGDFIEWWLENLVKPDRTPATYESYARLARGHIVHELGDTLIDKLTDDQVLGLKAAVRAKGVSPRTVEYVLVILRIVLTIAKRRGLVAQNVASLVALPKVPQRDAPTLDRETSARFMASIQGDRLFALYVLDLMLGLRRGEVLALRWQDVDLESARLSINGSLQRNYMGRERRDPKTQNSKRDIAIPQLVIPILKAHHARQLQEREQHKHWKRWQDTDYVFTTQAGGPIEPRRLTELFGELKEKLGLAPEMHFHDLRHSIATMLLEEGVDIKLISKLLGHADSQITRDVYIRHTDRLKQQTADKIDALFQGMHLDVQQPEEPGEAENDAQKPPQKEVG